MRDSYWLPITATAALLVSCVNLEPRTPALPPPAAAIAEADLVYRAGRHEQAFTMLQVTAFAHPLEKAPWIRMAQLRFERGQYGEAINSAAHAIELDPEDKLAHTILAVSGLRVSSRALSDLAVKYKLNGDLRTEAHELARLMRATIGEDVLVPLGTHDSVRPNSRQPESTEPPADAAPHRDRPFANLK